MLTIINRLDLTQALDTVPERRIDQVNLNLGDRTWMNPDQPIADWEVVESYVYKVAGTAPIEAIALVAVNPVGAEGDRTWIDPEFPETTITVYLLDGAVYENVPYSVASWNAPPEVGAFLELAPGSIEPLPLTKEITHYDTYLPTTGAPYPAIYVAHLSPMRVPASV